MNESFDIWIAHRRPNAVDVVAAATSAGFCVRRVLQLESEALEVDGCEMLLLEEAGIDVDEVASRAYSLSSANREMLLVILAPPYDLSAERTILDAGAFDLLDSSRDLCAQLQRTFSSARRVRALQGERQRLAAEIGHGEKLAALGLLAAGVSHEVNNPCHALLVNVSSLRDDLEAVMSRPRFQRLDSMERRVPEWLESLSDCLSAARRIQAIVQTLNVFSNKPRESGPVPVDPNSEINVVLRLIGKEVQFHSRFDVTQDPMLPRVMLPANALTQMVTNLVVNALQAIEQVDPLERRVSITTSFDDDNVMIEVADNGPGIPQDVMSRIFDPFFTTKPLGKGTGLGLSITRELVQRAGGDIFVESEPGMGACFRIVFPRIDAADRKTGRPPSMPPQSQRIRVLIVDDDDLLLRSMKRALAQQFECRTAGSADDALSVLRHDPQFDVVLTDVVMPGRNGLEFYRLLSEIHPELCNRTAFLSGGITSEQLIQSVTETGRPMLDKPLDLQQLARTIRAIATGPDAPALHL